MASDRFVAIESTPLLGRRREASLTTNWASKAKLIALTLLVLGAGLWLTFEMTGSRMFLLEVVVLAGIMLVLVMMVFLLWIKSCAAAVTDVSSPDNDSDTVAVGV